MTLTELFLAQGETAFADLLRRISMSRLRTYQIYEHIKLRARLNKLNSETLRKAAPRLWERLAAGEDDLAADLSQALLVSQLEMIIEALDVLGVPHQDGFFPKDADVKSHLTDGWQQKAFDALKDRHPANVLQFYLNHLAYETKAAETLFVPAA